MSTARANIKSEISADMSQFSATLRRASMSAKAAGAKISKGISSAAIGIAKAGAAATVAATAIAATAAAAALFKGMKGAAEIEQLGISFEVMTGSAEKGKAILEQIREFGAQTPYEFPALAKGAQTLLAFNVAADDVLPTMRMLGDIAAGDGQKMESLSLVFGQIASTGRLMGGDLLQLINAGFNPLQEISAKTGESMIELKKRMEAGLIPFSEVKQAFKDATTEGGRFFGMTDRQSNTFNGKMSTVKDSINNALTQFSAPINIALLPLLDNAIKMIDEATPKMAELGQSIADTLSGITLDDMQSALQKAIDFGVALKLGVDVLWAGLKTAFSPQFWDGVADLIKGTLMYAVNFFKAGFDAVVAGAMAFFAEIPIILYKAFSILKTQDFWSGLGNVLLGIAQTFGLAIIDILKISLEKLKSFNIPFLSGPLDGAIEKLGLAGDAIGESISKNMKEGADALSPTISEMGKAVGDSVGRIADAGKIAFTESKPVFDAIGKLTDGSTKIGGAFLGNMPQQPRMKTYSADLTAGGSAAAKLPALGSDNVFARDRARLGLANGLSTGGLGAKRAFGKAGKDKDMKKSETLQEKSVTTLESIDQKISQSLTVA
jgi:hypothetical protein